MQITLRIILAPVFLAVGCILTALFFLVIFVPVQILTVAIDGHFDGGEAREMVECAWEPFIALIGAKR